MDEKIYKIYKIQDNTNNNVYIGSTTQDIRDRVYRHRNYLKTGEYCSSSIVIKNDDYHFNQIDRCSDKETAKVLECFYINSFPNCINQKKLNWDKNIWQRQPWTCDLCNKTMTNNSKCRHKKTKAHLQNLGACE